MKISARKQIEKLPWGMIDNHAVKHGLRAHIVGAFILKESAGDQYAVRFEPGWKYRKDVIKHAKANAISQATETNCQMMSWGLLQIMGTVAREQGYVGPLSKLVAIGENLDIGCKKLAAVFKKYPKFEDAVAAYNAGRPKILSNGKYSNQQYVDRFKEHLKNIQEVRV